MHLYTTCNCNNCDLLNPLMYEFFRKYKFVNMVSVKNANQSNSINTNQWKKDIWHAHDQTSFLLLYSKINRMYDFVSYVSKILN